MNYDTIVFCMNVEAHILIVVVGILQKTKSMNVTERKCARTKRGRMN